MENVGILYGRLNEYLMAIWYILRPFGIFYDHLVYFTAIGYILWPFGIIFLVLEYQDKSGNPGTTVAHHDVDFVIPNGCLTQSTDISAR
jgi:hypothetical protein